MRRVAGVLVAAAVLSAMGNGRPAGNTELFTGDIVDADIIHCEDCFENSTQHTFSGIDCGSSPSADCYDCHSFNSCHSSAQPGTCDEYHNACHGDGLALESALDAGDGEAVRNLLLTTDGRVALNGRRRAVQLRDCHGHLVAHYPIKATLAESLGI